MRTLMVRIFYFIKYYYLNLALKDIVIYFNLIFLAAQLLESTNFWYIESKDIDLSETF